MAQSGNITTSVRKYSQTIGVMEWDGGIQYKDGTWSQHFKQAVIAKITETTVIVRGFESAAPDDSSLTMDTVTFIRGGLTVDSQKRFQFDYERESVTSECSRVSEAGFYTKTTVTKSATIVTT